MDLSERYFLKPGVAYVRGKLDSPTPYAELPLEELDSEQLESIFKMGMDFGMKMHKFKKTMGLPRVQRVLGIMQGLRPERVLDVGTGRGVFLWPFLDTFPDVEVHCIDTLDYRVEALEAIRKGGWEKLRASRQDVTELPFEDNHFEVSTALEVLEHIPDYELAVAELIRVTSGFLVISVPSRDDDNPEHIHLLDQKVFKEIFNKSGISQVKFDYVLNHMIIVVNVGSSKNQ